MNNFFGTQTKKHPYKQLCIDNRNFADRKVQAYGRFKKECERIKNEIMESLEKARKEMSGNEYDKYKASLFKQKDAERQRFYAVYAREKAEIQAEQDDNFLNYCDEKEAYNAQKKSNPRKGTYYGSNCNKKYFNNYSISRKSGAIGRN